MARLGLIRRLTLTAATLMPLLGALQASAQSDFLDQANDRLTLTPGNLAAQERLFPAIIGTLDYIRDNGVDLDQLGLNTDNPNALRRVALVDPGDMTWFDVEDFLLAEPQRNLIDTVNDTLNNRSRPEFNLQIGEAGLPSEWIEHDLCVRLGEQGLLVEADAAYLKHFRLVQAILVLEATRLAEEGEPFNAMAQYVNIIRLNRLLLDRPTVQAHRDGWMGMRIALEQLRHMVFTYSQPEVNIFTTRHMKDMVSELDERALRIERTGIPWLGELAANEIVSLTMFDRGGVNQSVFAKFMTDINSADEPLRAFNEAAKWRLAATKHRDTLDTLDQIERIYGDWRTRWGYRDLNDPLLIRPSDFDDMDPTAYSIPALTSAGMNELNDNRKALIMDLRGTRMSLAIVAFKLDTNNWPRNLNALQPEYIGTKGLDNNLDLYNIDRAGRYLTETNIPSPMTFFVPIRDDIWGRRETPVAHKIRVYPWWGEDASFTGSPLDRSTASMGDGAEALDELMAGLGEGFEALAGLMAPMITLGEYMEANPELVQELLDEAKDFLQGKADELGMTASEINDLLESLEEEDSDIMSDAPGLMADPNSPEAKVMGALMSQEFLDRIRPKFTGEAAEALDSLIELFTGAMAMPQDGEEFDPSQFMEMMGGAASQPSFIAEISSNQFILYSLAENELDDRAIDTQEDWIYWPPQLSLELLYN